MDRTKAIQLTAALIIIAGVIAYIQWQSPKQTGDNPPPSKPMLKNQAPDISTPDGFINTEPITIKQFVGQKVVLVDFWTYSCINCQRTTPYLNEWYARYRDKGLVIIGVHTPEFSFEQKYDNVKAAVEKFGIKYPVVLDNDYSTWRAYRNQYWPRKYLISRDGQIIYDHIGEGGYEETEMKIQEALQLPISRPSATSATDYPVSPETYFGAARNDRLVRSRATPASIEADKLYLIGDWEFTQEYAQNKSADAKIIYRYQGQKVHFVAAADQPIELQLARDGQPITPVTVQADQLYTLVDDELPGERTLEITIPAPGLRAYTFTFG